MTDKKHVMNLTNSYPTGASEWTCPICGRKFVMQVSPYKHIVLVVGNTNAVHAAVNSAEPGFGIGGFEVEPKTSDDAYLGPYEKFMKDHSEW